MRARDIMVTDFETIRMDTPLMDAITKLRQRQLITGKMDVRVLVVTDENGEPRHLLTEADVIREILPFFFKDKKFADFVNKWLAKDLPQASFDELFRDLARNAKKKSVKDVAFPDHPLISVDEDDSILKVAHTMHMQRIKSVPVTRGGKLVGICFRGAVFEAIAAEMEKGRAPSNPSISVPKI